MPKLSYMNQFGRYWPFIPHVWGIPFTDMYSMKNCSIRNGKIELQYAGAQVAVIGSSFFPAFGFEYHSDSIVYFYTQFFGLEAASPYRRFIALTQTTTGLISGVTYFNNSSRTPSTPYYDPYPTIAFYNNMMYYNDGTTAYGSSLEKYHLDIAGTVKIFVPSGVSVPALTTNLGNVIDNGAGGTLGAGTYDYKITFVCLDSYNTLESNASDSDGVTIAANRVIRVPLSRAGAIPDPTTTGLNYKIRVYRRAPTESVFSFIYETGGLASDAFVNFDDNGSLTPDTLRQAPDRHTQIQERIFCINIYKDRLFAGMADGKTLRYSENGFPDYIPALNAINVGSPEDHFTCLIPYPNFLVIIKQRSIWILEGASPSDFILNKVLDEGTNSPMVGRVGDVLYFFVGQVFKRWKPGLNAAETLEDFTYLNAVAPAVNPTPVHTAKYVDVQYNPIDGLLYIAFFNEMLSSGASSGFFTFDPVKGTFVGNAAYTSGGERQHFVQLSNGFSKPCLGYAQSGGSTLGFFSLSAIPLNFAGSYATWEAEFITGAQHPQTGQVLKLFRALDIHISKTGSTGGTMTSTLGSNGPQGDDTGTQKSIGISGFQTKYTHYYGKYATLVWFKMSMIGGGIGYMNWTGLEFEVEPVGNW